MHGIESIFGSMVFNDSVMREKLPAPVYTAMKTAIAEGRGLDRSIADTVASAMKDWAVEKGATHYTHWFQPMTGVTAEKHEAFLSPDGNGGVIAGFSGKELIKGEPDASAFPSGGLRATFEARGYTAWDPSSYAFIKGTTLCIPTAFWSYNGEVLDMKTPLLRSVEALNRAAIRILRILGDTETRRVIANAGAEQEYFLVEEDLFRRRPDLVYTGRTLFGARPARGQEGSYSGALREKVEEFMADVDQELWKLGIYAKTEHAEAAPAQHELAPVYSDVNTATDHNQLTMELLKKIACHHGMECLLHEKPYFGVNGSGKHNNWSLSTDRGENLLDPGSEPGTNLRFMIFFSAVLRGVDLFNDLLYISVASAANDQRLGGHEAPPAIISMYLGDKLESILEAVEKHEAGEADVGDYYDIGLGAMPRFRRDTSDRNRTSPFAFTGNKFEFRMPGANQSIAFPNTVLNTIVADSLNRFADDLEQAENVEGEAWHVVRSNFRKHSRIIFNGNNYSAEWAEEAARRGIVSFSSSEEAFRHLTDEKNVRLFERAGIFSSAELSSRYEILLADYVHTVTTEARTMLDMARRDILPAVSAYSREIADACIKKKSLDLPCEAELSLARRLSILLDGIATSAEELDRAIRLMPEAGEAARASHCRGRLVPLMATLRDFSDRAELITASDYWPYPSYGELLHITD